MKLSDSDQPCLQKVDLRPSIHLPFHRFELRDLAYEGVPQGQVNKSDRNDARGIAQMMRVGLFRPVHVKTLASQKHPVLFAGRKLLQENAIAIEQ